MRMRKKSSMRMRKKSSMRMRKKSSMRMRKKSSMRMRNKNSVKRFTGLLGDRCPIGSSVNEAENNKKDRDARWELNCYKNCGTFESTKDLYDERGIRDPNPNLKNLFAARICNGNKNNPMEKVKRE